MSDDYGSGDVAMRDLASARKAFEDGDIEASKSAHENKVTAAKEHHSTVGGHIKSIV